MANGDLTNRIVNACFKATVFVLVSAMVNRVATSITDSVTIVVNFGKKT